MRASDIVTYEDLQKYIRLELARQTTGKRTVLLELPECHFSKLLKLIQFCLRDDPNERMAQITLPKDLKIYYVKINGYTTTVTKAA